MRQCGDCQLCCKLLPLNSGEDAQATRTAAEMIKHRLLSLKEAASMIKTFDKPAGQACQYQRHGKGCTIYDRRPLSCRVWNCRWLVNDDADDLRRPDRSHYVIDVMPDFVTLVDNDTGARTNVEVVQIWVDPSYPDAHRDPELRAYIERQGQKGIAAIIRYSEMRAMTIFPPSMSSDGQWHEVTHGEVRPRRTAAERFAGIASARKVKVG
jgi:Putative zinc- or iron-chelating domain